MIEREIKLELSQEAEELLFLEDIVGEEEIYNLIWGHTAEQDHDAPNGYILELIVRRKVPA